MSASRHVCGHDRHWSILLWNTYLVLWQQQEHDCGDSITTFDCHFYLWEKQKYGYCAQHRRKVTLQNTHLFFARGPLKLHSANFCWDKDCPFLGFCSAFFSLSSTDGNITVTRVRNHLVNKTIFTTTCRKRIPQSLLLGGVESRQRREQN